jgi:hypothetical protein
LKINTVVHIHFFTSSLSNTVLMASTVQIEGQSGKGGVVHAIDVYRGEGAKVFLATRAK